MIENSVIIIGAGQAGFQCAHSLQLAGFAGRITLIGDETHLPYQRPPLSKAFLSDAQDEQGLLLRQPDFYAAHDINVILGTSVKAINPDQNSVVLSNRDVLSYTHLVLATGARVRKLDVEGAQLDGVVYMRSLNDAIDIKTRMETAQNIVVIGGGFIGLEFAAVARKFGKDVTVIEAAPRLMARAVAPVVSDYFADKHRQHGVDLLFNTQIKRIIGFEKVEGVELSDGSRIEADMVLVGIGVLANDNLIQDANLKCNNGIVVDEYLTTSHSNIYAIGDCVQHHNVFGCKQMRVESVQNAIDQAKCVAANIMRQLKPYRAVPWFWSDQYDLKLQMVGLSQGFDSAIVRGNMASDKFSVFHFAQSKLIGIDSVNKPADHMLGRKLIDQGLSVPMDVVSDEAVDLKAYLK